MSLYDDVKRTLRSLLLFEERLDRILERMTAQERTLADHEKRLIRIETLIELAREERRRLD